MKKILFILSLFLFLIKVQAQTGINTTNPGSSLEVASQSGANGVVGVLFPRSSGNDLAKIVDASFDGTIIYVTSPAVNPSDATIQVLNKGYYYYNAKSQRWTLLGGTYDNVIEENLMMYAQVKRQGTLHLQHPNHGNSTDSNQVFDNYVTWHSIEGTPAATKTIENEFGEVISTPIRINGSVITLPKGHVFRVTAMVSIVAATRAGYVVAKFEASPSKSILASTYGYIETADEPYQDGGVSYPVAIVDASNENVRLELNAAVHGHRFKNRNLVLAGGESDDPYYTTYLVIEEIK